MKHFLLRILAGILGIAAILDGVLPARTEQLVVAAHVKDVSGDGDAYYLEFAHTRPARCTVTTKGFRAAEDGQRITVYSSALAHLCTGIVVGGERFSPPLLWQFTNLCVLAVCLGIACFPQRRKHRPSA